MSTTDDISTHDQDAKWPAPRLITVGAIALGIALAIIYIASRILGE